MRKMMLIAIALSCLQLSLAESSGSAAVFVQKTNSGFIIYKSNTLKIISVSNPHKKTIKEKFLYRLFIKLKKQNTEDTDKKRNKKKAIISAAAGGLSIFLFILTLILADGFAALGGVLLSLIAVVMGIRALRRSKKFTDSNNSGRSAAIAGIVLGCIGFAAFLLWTIIELSSMS